MSTTSPFPRGPLSPLSALLNSSTSPLISCLVKAQMKSTWDARSAKSTDLSCKMGEGLMRYWPFCLLSPRKLGRSRDRREKRSPMTESADYAVPDHGMWLLPHSQATLRLCPPFFLHGSRRYVCRGCTSHLRLVKREIRTKRQNETTKKPNQTTKTNPHTKGGKVRTSSRLCQPVEKSETR